MSSNYDIPDREGFETLMRADFVRVGDMVFRKGHYDSKLVAERTTDPEEVQRQMNHTHVSLYAVTTDVQSAWADELVRQWSNRFLIEFPDLNVVVRRMNESDDVVVTFWSEAKR
jgi:hypothetical protein